MGGLAMDLDGAVADALKGVAEKLSAEEILLSPPDVIAGVDEAARAALADLEVRTVFDLAAAHVFATAVRLLAAERDPRRAEAQLNAVPSDAVSMLDGVSAGDLAAQQIAILKAIGPALAPAVSEALDVSTVRDLALWPPYHVAKRILATAFLPDGMPE